MCGIGAGAFKGRRFAYLSGLAPVEQILREMQAGMFSYFGTNYMKQFFQLIKGCDAQANIVAWRFRQKVNGVKRNGTVTYHGFCKPSRMKAIISRAMSRWWPPDPISRSGLR